MRRFAESKDVKGFVRQATLAVAGALALVGFAVASFSLPYGVWPFISINAVLLVLALLAARRGRFVRDGLPYVLFLAYELGHFAGLFLVAPSSVGATGMGMAGEPARFEGIVRIGERFLDWQGAAHMQILCPISAVLVAAGLLLLVASFATGNAGPLDALVVTGPYAHVRHPEHTALLIVAFGLLVEHPAWATASVFLLIVPLFRAIALGEEGAARRSAGSMYDTYAAVTPAFLPFG